jgi:hypothetical protein
MTSIFGENAVAFEKPHGFYPNGSIHCMLLGSLFLIKREWPVELQIDPPFLDALFEMET